MAEMLRVKVQLNGWQGSPGFSQFYFQKTGGAPVATIDAVEAHARVQAAYVSARDLYPTIWNWSADSLVDVLDPNTGDLINALVGGAAGGDVGTSGSDFGPASTGIVLNYTTAAIVNGQRVRGRTFFSPIHEGGDANGTPAELDLQSVRDFGLTLRTLIATSLSQVVWHRPVGGTGGSAHDVISSYVRDSFSVLRSRR